MKVPGGHIPKNARVVGISGTARNLDIDASLKTLRPLLPVKDGGLTVSIFWPEEKLPVGGLGTSVAQLASHFASSEAALPKKTTCFAEDWAVPQEDQRKEDRGTVAKVSERGRKRALGERAKKKKAAATGTGVDKDELAKLVQKLKEANDQANSVATKAKKAKKRHREDAKTRATRKLGSVSKRGKFAEGTERKSRSSCTSGSSCSSSSSSDSESNACTTKQC